MDHNNHDVVSETRETQNSASFETRETQNSASFETSETQNSASFETRETQNSASFACMYGFHHRGCRAVCKHPGDCSGFYLHKCMLYFWKPRPVLEIYNLAASLAQNSSYLCTSDFHSTCRWWRYGWRRRSLHHVIGNHGDTSLVPRCEPLHWPEV